MATSLAGPSTGSPPIFTVPSVGRVRPAMIRNRVDLPEPERPSRATISPVFMRMETSLSTGERASPEPVEKTWLTLSTSRIVAMAVSNMGRTPNDGSQTQPPLRVGIEPSPEQAVEQSHKDRHHRDAEHNSREVTLVRGLGDVRSDGVGGDGVIFPPDVFSHDRSVP